MTKSKVEFIEETGQKIIIDFTLEDSGDLDYHISFDPKVTDPKANLGLSGQFCKMFIEALTASTTKTKKSPHNNTKVS